MSDTAKDPILGPNISNAQTIIGGMHAIATALYDTIEDTTLPNNLRKIQLKKLVGNIDELKVEIGKTEAELAKKDQALALIRGQSPLDPTFFALPKRLYVTEGEGMSYASPVALPPS